MAKTWKNRTRYNLSRDKSWKPCVCIQGGGAKGAWEAGVLSTLLKSKSTGAPVALWGTSAGAINAVWASCSTSAEQPENLLAQWLLLAQKIRLACFIVICCVVALACFLGCKFLYGFLTIFGSAILLGCVLDRIPGAIPVTLAARLLPRVNSPARWNVYVCTADVSVPSVPELWEWETLGIFRIDPGATCAKIATFRDEREFEPRLAAMISAAIPIVCRPFLLGTKRLLDGGLFANLPAGFIRSQGMLGGNCAICILPRPLDRLNPDKHIDCRIIRFLRELQVSQQQNRARSAPKAGVHKRPANTMTPVFVLSPSRELRSGLVWGFFSTRLLRTEFFDGRSLGEDFLRTLESFENGNDNALDSYLLDSVRLPSLPDRVPSPGRWRFWANRRW